MYYSNVLIGLGKAYIIIGCRNSQSPNRSTRDALVFKQTVDIQIGTNCAPISEKKELKEECHLYRGS